MSSPEAIQVSSVPQRRASEVLAQKLVLLVDDEDDCRDLHRRILQACGAEVIEASDVAEALHALQRVYVDLLVSDIGMPKRDGYALIRAVRSFPGTAALPAIALTARNGDEDRLRALSAGFDAHLGKPLDAAHLLAAIEPLIRSTDRR